MSMGTRTQQPAPLARSSSFFGAIKNIVTAPLQWLSGTDEFEDTRGKRRRLPVSSEESRAEEDSLQGRAKRMRVSSPGRDSQPYLDPPTTAFRQPRRASEQIQQRRLTASPRKSLRVPTELGGWDRSTRRHTASPLPSRSHLAPEGITRTMSLDPPPSSGSSLRTQSMASMQDVREEVEDSMAISRDPSMSPGRQLRVRSSLTPQPSGPSFGPAPPRREHDPNQPPPLTALRSNPTFVKPPAGRQKSDATEPPKQLTLGSLVESQRNVRPLVRQNALLFGTGSTTDISTGNLWPANAAEKVLHDLEVYKTPLLPTRLKGSATIPDMFLPKKSHRITLMNDDRDDKPRLGMKGKGKDKGKKKEKNTPNKSKPYAGEGGMKKWLARRRVEEEQLKKKEKADAMEDDNGEIEHRRSLEEETKERKDQLAVPPPPPDTAFQPGLVRDGQETSSLRVGRTKPTRTHERPILRRMKFSAAYEDEDEDMGDSRAAEQYMLEEAAKKAPTFEIPAGFTFAKETTITHDVTNAKEPPISSLPFSLTKPTVAATSAPPPADPILKSVLPTESSEPRAVSLAPPPIILSPPTPDKGAAVSSTLVSAPPPTTLAPVVTAPLEIPNFFATSSVFAKPPAAVAAPLLSLTGAPPVEKPVTVGEEKTAESVTLKADELVVPAPSAPQPSMTSSVLATASSAPSGTSIFGAPSTSTGPPATSIFGASSKPTGSPATSLWGAPVASSGTVTPSFGLSAPSKGSGADAAPPFGVTKAAEPLPPAVSEPQKMERKEAEPPTTKPAAPFGFGFTTPATSTPSTEAPKPPFAFGQPTVSTASSQPEATKTPFGGASSPFSFGPPAASEAAKKEEKPASSAFSFGAPAASEAAKKEEKPASSPFSFGASVASETTKNEEKPAPSPFSFGAAPAQPANESKPASAFSFGATTTTTAPAPTFTFGAPSSGSNAADVSSKPFSFAPATPARPATPPKIEQEVSMDESPTREMNLNGNGKAPERPTLSFPFGTQTPAGSALFAQSPVTPSPAFAFGTPAVNPFAKDTKAVDDKLKVSSGFGQQPSTGFSFGQKPPESPAVASPAPFSFGQPSPSVAPTSPFTFGPAASNPFAQASTAGASAPPSPSTFNRPASTPAFTFGSSATTQPSSAPFSFGTSSQPASPANNNTALPPSSGAPAFTFGAASGTTAPSNLFNPSAPAPAGGGTLFTIGSAPPPPEGGRQIKKLPRRGGARR